MPPRVVAGNPLWVEWLKEVVAEEQERGSKATDSYRKAANALAKNPVTFAHPEEARAIVGVGPGTVVKLTARLKLHCEQTGEPFPEPPAPPGKKRKAAQAPVTSDKVAAIQKRVRGVGPTSDEEREQDAIKENRRRRTLNLPELPLPSARQDNAPAPAKARKTKAYVPKRRSGAYALLVALYKNSTEDEPSTWVLKSKLIADALEYSDTPFEKPSVQRIGGAMTGAGAAAVYSAWNSMKTLTTKELVVSDNKRPMRFALTDSGYELAHTLAPDADIPVHNRQAGPVASGSGSGSGQRLGRAALHPSSGGSFPGSGMALGRGAGPSSSDSGIGYGGYGRGQQGNAAAGPSRARPPARKRTPPPFLDDDDDRTDSDDADSDPEFARQMREARRLGMKESGASLNGGSNNAAAKAAPYRAHPGGHARPLMPLPLSLDLDKRAPAHLERMPSSDGLMSGGRGPSQHKSSLSSTVLDPKKAAHGLYASHAASKDSGPTLANIDSAFGYFYLDQDDNRVTKRDDAEVSQEDGTLSTLYRIEYRVGQDLHKMAAGVQRKSALVRAVALPGGSTKSGYIRERVSNLLAPGFPGVAPVAPPDPKKVAKNAVTDLLAGFKSRPKVVKDAMYAPPPEVRRFGAETGPPARAQNLADKTIESRAASRALPWGDASLADGRQDKYSMAEEQHRNERHLPSLKGKERAFEPPAPAPPPWRPAAGPDPKPASVLRQTLSSDDVQPLPKPRPPPAPAARPPANRALARSTSTQNPLIASFSDGAHSKIINRHPLDPVRDHVARSDYVFRPFVPRVLKAGTFKVVLIVDAREGGHTLASRLELVRLLEGQGVRADRKQLCLGDMLWVARPVDASGIETGEDDVVLDAIIERKRLDDLTTSIKDGRYASQKVRIKDSAITQRIYLIENFDDRQQYAESGKAIWTCKSQLQVNDGFYVHEAGNFRETISFLKTRTQVMVELYESSDLTVLPDSIIDRPTFLALQKHLHQTEPQTRYLTTYTAFEQLNKVDSALTLGTQWASMIQRVSGLSAEKAVQLITQWDTPRAFFDGCRVFEREVEREKRALELEDAETGRKGPKKKARKVEDFVVETLNDDGPRSIKNKLGAKIYTLFSAQDRYAD